jgi:hypothetical protein
VCRFSDAGNDDLTTGCGGRRPKSAKARTRRASVRYQRPMTGVNRTQHECTDQHEIAERKQHHD